MLEPTPPVDQLTVPAQPVAVNVVDSPGLTIEGEAARAGAEGIGFTNTATLPDVPTQLFSVQVAV